MYTAFDRDIGLVGRVFANGPRFNPIIKDSKNGT